MGSLDIAGGAVGEQNLTVSGSGSVRYIGDSTVEKGGSGMGDIEQIGE